MTQKRVDLSTCVWGGWHLETMQHVMLPTLLSPGNLPEISRRFPLRYRIATTPDDRKRIEAWPIFSRLAATVEIEWITEKAAPDITYHIEWYKRALSDAKAANSYCFMAYPDVAWNDGLFSRCADAIAGGKVGVAIPYIRVISETLVPEMTSRSRGEPLRLSGGELVHLGMRHMHPLSVATMAGGPHALPSLEVCWRMPNQGLILRQMSRELSMVDTERLQANQYWNTIETAHSESLHIATDSDDMLMLSLAPLFKDFQVYIPNHSLCPIDLARISLHPDNNNPLVNAFATHPIRLHYDDLDENHWRKFELDADRFIDEALAKRRFLGVWEAAHKAGCSLASQALSVGLISTSLARHLPHDGPMTIYIPNDQAFGEHGWQALAPLLRPKRAAELQRMILNHIILGPHNDEPGSWRRTALGGAVLQGRSNKTGKFVDEARIVRRLDLEPHRVFIVDRLLASAGTGATSLPDAPQLEPGNSQTDQSPVGADRVSLPAPGPALGGWLRRLAGSARAAAPAVAGTLHTGLSRLGLRRPFSPANYESIARRYPAFLGHFGIELKSEDLKRQIQGAATALYQAGLYRHKLLFQHELMAQFSTLGGTADPRPAFFDYCISLAGREPDLAQTEGYYQLALHLAPDFAEALYALGQLARRAARTDEALSYFEAAASTPPHPQAMSYAHIAANSWRNLAEMHRDQRNFEMAETCFRKALSSHGIHGAYHAEIAEFFRARGQLADAAKQYELAMPYSHLYPCEFSEPHYRPEEKLPADLNGRPCDPLKPTIVSDDAQGGRLVYWWHIYLRVAPQVPLDADALFRLKPQGRLPIMETGNY